MGEAHARVAPALPLTDSQYMRAVQGRCELTGMPDALLPFDIHSTSLQGVHEQMCAELFERCSFVL